MDQIKGFLPSAGLCSQVYHKEQFVPQEVLDGALSWLLWPFLQDFAGVKAPNVECARLSPSPIMCSACLLPQRLQLAASRHVGTACLLTPCCATHCALLSCRCL